MQPADIYVQLRRLLNATDAPIVLAAVSSDPLVWKALQEPEFLQNALSEECVIASAWSPANLALRPFSSQISFAELTAEHIPGIEVSLRKKALELLETTLRNPAPVQSLEQAGLLALALRERRRKMQSWRGFLGELLSVPAGSADRYFELWQTPLACLYGMIPDKWDFLESLLPQNAMHPAVDWISHIILSNPLDQSTQVTLFHDLMNHLAVEYQVEWLKILSGKGHFSLVSGIADKLLNSDREFFDTLEEAFVPDQAEWVVTSRKILDTQLAATLNQMADRPLQAGIYLEKTRTYLHHWFLGSTIQHASLGGTSVNNESNLSAECAGLMSMAPVNEGL